jgi:hypothetical protein
LGESVTESRPARCGDDHRPFPAEAGNLGTEGSR